MEVLDVDDAGALGNNLLFHNGELIGRDDVGFRLGKILTLGMLRPGLTAVGTELKFWANAIKRPFSPKAPSIPTTNGCMAWACSLSSYRLVKENCILVARVSDLSNIGIGSSRIQTIGPMRAGYMFASDLSHSGVLEHVARVSVELFGSLGLSGQRHGADKAVLLGLSGVEPEDVDPSVAADLVSDVLDGGVLSILQLYDLPFKTQHDVVFHQRQSLPGQADGMRFKAFNEDGEAVHQRVYYSTDGDAIVDEAFLEEH